ncbi:hypothetical protein E5Q_04282 [Mixia osmundae IAM 14324]|uniref:PLAC8-domain-containing protein n=2 Tax=Mixia osmundae (strain CBS 9802 / IAM 14324 / JCM 22182 / KY 12970) TaxID=764103 RepID=G7E444_MIXOS|nr:hypothetical protein E5Q_04282 [Mixia osmundae IAM 14324]
MQTQQHPYAAQQGHQAVPAMQHQQAPVYVQQPMHQHDEKGMPYRQHPQHMQQPQAMPAMVATADNILGRPRDADGKREWSYGLCSGKTCSGCLFPYFCSCISYGHNAQRYEALRNTGRPKTNPEIFSSPCMLWLLVSCIIPPSCIFLPGQREQIASRYGIRTNGCSECCLSIFCAPCMLSQASRELELEEQAIR